MPKLTLVINCLCLFVRDEQEKTVHVLMPATGHTGHDGHDGGGGHQHPEHLVQVLHRSFDKGQEKDKGRSMKGWALVLGEGDASADTTLEPPVLPPLGDEVVNLTNLIDKEIERRLVADQHNPEVAARITLRSGRVTRVVAEAEWELKNRSIFLAHQVTWEMLGVPHDLTWIKLDPNAGDPPLKSLKELEPEDNLGYRIEIHHVTNEGLPPTSGGPLKPEEMAEHFRAFYSLFGMGQVDDSLLPKLKSQGVKGVNCGTSSAMLAAA